MSIQSMRDQSQGIVAKIIVGLIIIVFAAFGMGSITTFLAPTPKVATVNGADVTEQEMAIALERQRRLLLAQNQPVNEDALRQQVLDSLINRKLFTVAAEDLGLGYSDAALDADIVSTEAFQVDGVFNGDQFQLILGSAGYTPVTYRNEVRKDKMFDQMSSGLQASAFMTEKEARRTSKLSQQSRDVAYLRVDVDELKGEMTASEDEIEAYYNAHPEEFMTEEMVDISYVELKRDDFLDDVEINDTELMSFFEDTRASYSEPERRRAAHILVEVFDEDEDAAAKEKIDGIYEQLTSGGDFTALAKEFSQDPGSAENGGDLGFTDKGTFVPEFEDVVYTLSKNQISEPFKTEFGYHIVKLLDVEEGKEPDFEEVKDKVIEEFKEVGAEELFVTESARLSEISYESPDLFEPAQELGLEVMSTGLINVAGTSETEDAIAKNPQVLESVLSADVLVDGNNSQLIEITPNHHVVARVKEHQPSAIKPLAEVSEQVRDVLLLEKAEKEAVVRAEKMVAMLNDGSVTRYVADQFGLEWEVVADAKRNQLGVDREINTEAFSLPRPAEGEKSVGYAVLADGDTVVLSVTNVKNLPDAELDTENLSALTGIMAGQQGRIEYSQFQSILEAESNIKRVN